MKVKITYIPPLNPLGELYRIISRYNRQRFTDDTNKNDRINPKVCRKCYDELDKMWPYKDENKKAA